MNEPWAVVMHTYLIDIIMNVLKASIDHPLLLTLINIDSLAKFQAGLVHKLLPLCD